MNIATKLLSLSSLVAAVLFTASGCAQAATPDPIAPASAGDVVTIEDAWVKSGDEGMSAAFGVLSNAGDTDATVVSVSSEASSMLELHETVQGETGEMVMREVEGGFIIPAGEDLVLEPGANHIMMMDLTDPLLPGDEVVFTLTFDDDSAYEFTAPVKDYAGANENYDGDDGGH